MLIPGMVFKAWFELILLYHKLVLPSPSNVIMYIEIVVGFFIFFLFMQNQSCGMCEICLWKKKTEEWLVLSLSASAEPPSSPAPGH